MPWGMDAQRAQTVLSTRAVRAASIRKASRVSKNSSRICASVNPCPSDRCLAAVIVANPYGLCDVVHENLPVADLSTARSLADRFHHFVQPRIRHDQLEFHFRQQIGVVLLPPVNFAVALLPAVAAHFADRHAVDAYVFQRFFYVFELEWLDY